MKTIARVGAILSFTFFLIPGAWVFAHANAHGGEEAIGIGFCLLGIAVLLGTILWLVGEKCCSKLDRK
jgi:hypothetical protein